MTKTYSSKVDSFPYKSHQLAKWVHTRWIQILKAKADAEQFELGKRQLEEDFAAIDSDDLAGIISDEEIQP